MNHRHLVAALVAAVAASSLFSAPARAYFVLMAPTIEELDSQADVVFKGTAGASVLGSDKDFPPYTGFGESETIFNVRDVVRGELPATVITFRHYDVAQAPPNMRGNYAPHSLHFDPGRSYLIFAKRTAIANVYRQLSTDPIEGGFDAIRCANGDTGFSGSLKQRIFAELSASLASPNEEDVRYGIDTLDRLSGGFSAVSDFDRTAVDRVVAPLMKSGNATIARDAIAVIGEHNPYFSPDFLWLPTGVGAEMPEATKYDVALKNAGGARYAGDLAEIASGKSDGATRAQAIRALGLVRDRAIEKPLVRWLADSEPGVRAAAVLLLADYPAVETHERYRAAAADGSPAVREAAAFSIGYAQRASEANILSKLLDDPDRDVRRYAQSSAVSFSPQNAAFASIFKAHVHDPEFAPLFLNALATADPATYRDALADAVKNHTQPTNWTGGEAPDAVAWQLLFTYLKTQPASELASGKLDPYLDALESAHDTGAEPASIYALYVRRGLIERAKTYRRAASERAGYDLEPMFDSIDRSPDAYL